MIIVVEPTAQKARFRAFGAKKDRAHEWEYSKELDRTRLTRQLTRILRELRGNEPLEAVAFRLRFGGSAFHKPVRLTGSFSAQYARSARHFPLYVPPVNNLIALFVRELKNTPLFAFFETSLFSALPRGERSYPIASEFYDDGAIMKWGYHGIFHGAHAGMFEKKDRVISIVMDNHTTVCAIKGRAPLTVSLGCTPLEGIMSARSCGDIDPGLIIYLMKEHGFSLYRIDEILKNESGFIGMTGYHLPPADLIRFYGRNEKVTLAFEVYRNQVLKHIGDGIAMMGGVDRIIFTGELVKPLNRIIYSILKDMSFLEMNLTEMPWDLSKTLVPLTSAASKRHAYITTLDETDIIRNATRHYLHK